MLGSYYEMTDDMYRTQPAGTPGWQMAPVPGWGINPLRAGPQRVGVGCASCQVQGLGSNPDGSWSAGNWVVFLGVVGVLGYGAWWMLARYPEYANETESHGDKTGAGAMARYRKHRNDSDDKVVGDLMRTQGWSKERAIKAVY
jgi:hypothetical protein